MIEEIINKACLAMEEGEFVPATFALAGDTIKYAIRDERDAESLPLDGIDTLVYSVDLLSSGVPHEELTMWNLFIGSPSKDPNSTPSLVFLIFSQGQTPMQITIPYRKDNGEIAWGERKTQQIRAVKGFHNPW